MRIRRLHLHPFAGTPDREVTFASGLNVVLGPNEAGKTTLRKALRQVLFVPTKLTKRQAEEEVLPYLPLGGGDTTRVTVDLENEGRVWKLTKRWTGGNSASELHLPDGGLLSEGTAVEEALASLLGLSQGTWEHVLFATQGGLGSCLVRLDEGSDLEDLNSTMRRAVFETDGVSIEKLGAQIEARYDQLFGRWDRELNRPEANRGLENPWARGAGTILAAWYERERARFALEEAEAYYRHLDQINARLAEASSESEALRAWVESRSSAARDAERRAGFEAELAKVEAKGAGLKQISREWPVVENKRGEQEARAAHLREKAAALAVELAKAKAWESAAKVRDLLTEAEKLQARIDTVRREKNATVPVEAAQIETLEALEKEGDRLRARLEAASLKVSFRATKALRLETRDGVADFCGHTLDAGESLDFEAGGRVRLRDAEGAWELEVSSGDIDVTAEETRFEELATEAAALLKAIGVADLAAARTVRAAFQEKTREVAGLEKQLADLLGPDRTLEGLRSELGGVQGEGETAPPARNVGDLSADHARTGAEAEAAEREAKTLRARIEVWTVDFPNEEALLDRLVELRAEHQKVKAGLDALQPLPEGFSDTQRFLEEYRRKKDALDLRKTATNQILVEKASLEGKAPQLEPAEAAERLLQSERELRRAHEEGAALERIRREYVALRAEMDGGTLDPWLSHLAEVVAPLTLERYRGIRLEEGTATAASADALGIPLAVLSAGTRASLGLAVRLSMARWFLEGRDGFLVLDDPLVDLDPDRQEAAAAVLRQFAKDKQVILLTCHPRHAEILGGTLVEL